MKSWEVLHTGTVTASHGRPSLVQVVKIFGAFFCTAIPNRMRDAAKMKVFAAEKAAIINRALTMEGSTKGKGMREPS